tara:strand:- start:1632 stop:2471 length:840 start_codon:yes stop_codon:yes gene_type:complete
MNKLFLIVLSTLFVLVGCGNDATSSIKPDLIDFVNPEIKQTGDEYIYFQAIRAIGLNHNYKVYMEIDNISKKNELAKKTSLKVLEDSWESLLFDYSLAGYAYFYYRDIRNDGFDFNEPGVTKEKIENDWRKSFISLVPIHNQVYIRTNKQKALLEGEGYINSDEKSLNEAFDRHRGQVFNEETLPFRSRYVNGPLKRMFIDKKSNRLKYANDSLTKMYHRYSVDGLEYILSRLAYDFSKLTLATPGSRPLITERNVLMHKKRLAKIKAFDFDTYYKEKL